VRVPAHDQRDFFAASPSFELRLSGEGLVYVVVGLPIEQADDVVSVSEPFEVMELVLEDATVEIATHANVESAGDASHDVGAVVAGGLVHWDIV